MPKQASDITNGIDVVKPPPGLRSVASATATPCSISIRAGAKRPSFRKNAADGSSVATTSRSASSRACGFVDEDQVIGRSRADVGGDRGAAAQAEFVGVDARLQPVAGPASRMRLRFVRREHAGLAEHVTPLGESVRSATAGIITSMTQPHVRVAVVPRNSTGTSCAPMNVAVNSIGCAGASSLDRAQHPPLGRRGRGRSRSSLRPWSCRTPASRPAGPAPPSTRSCSLARARRVDRLDDAAARLRRSRHRWRRPDGGATRRGDRRRTSRWVWGSTKPGTTVQPWASITCAFGVRLTSRAAASARMPTKTIRPSKPATDAVRRSREMSRCAEPRRGPGPAQVATRSALSDQEIRESRSDPDYAQAPGRTSRREAALLQRRDGDHAGDARRASSASDRR